MVIPGNGRASLVHLWSTGWSKNRFFGGQGTGRLGAIREFGMLCKEPNYAKSNMSRNMHWEFWVYIIKKELIGKGS